MKMKKIAAIILAVSMLYPAAAIAAPEKEAEPEKEYSGEYMAFDQIADYISQLYIDEYDKQDIMNQGLSEFLSGNDDILVQLLKSTLESMDDYSEFYTAEEYKQFEDNLSHLSYGIGIAMKENEDGLFEITDFAEDNDNAKNAGIEIGDIITKVDGVSVRGIGMDAVRGMVVGDEGTSVIITVLRGDDEKDITVTRGVSVNMGTVDAQIYDGNIGYIRIYSFGAGTDEEFTDALNFMRENDVKKIMLDLRDNTGGWTTSVIAIAQQIVPKGKIIDMKFRLPSDNATYTSTLAKKEFDFAVLVNENTASASEILASALQDSKAGTLIGTTTFGKAVVQNVYPLQNGSIIKLTAGEYITRNGKEINKIGLTPDKYVENEVSKFDSSEYTQFDYNTKISLGQSHPNVKAAKERLNLMGDYDGEINEVFDEEFYDTIKVYQSLNDIFAYGVLDAPTMKMIESTISEYDVVKDLQFEAAYELLGGVIKK